MHVGFGEIREGLGFWRGGYKGAMGDKREIVYKQPGTEVDDSYHNWRVPSK
jgi:hypothetical protein